MSIDTFGPAFPVSPESAERLGCVFTHEDVGLTKRDWFAAMALSHPYTQDKFEGCKPDADEIAGWAYRVADAMLKERNQC